VASASTACPRSRRPLFVCLFAGREGRGERDEACIFLQSASACIITDGRQRIAAAAATRPLDRNGNASGTCRTGTVKQGYTYTMPEKKKDTPAIRRGTHYCGTATVVTSRSHSLLLPYIIILVLLLVASLLFHHCNARGKRRGEMKQGHAPSTSCAHHGISTRRPGQAY
jgi:hypothetical protein